MSNIECNHGLTLRAADCPECLWATTEWTGKQRQTALMAHMVDMCCSLVPAKIAAKIREAVVIENGGGNYYALRILRRYREGMVTK